MFSLLIQGLNALDAAHPTKDSIVSTEQAIVEFAVDSPEAIKIVGRWFDVNRIRVNNPTATIGPIVPPWTRAEFKEGLPRSKPQRQRTTCVGNYLRAHTAPRS
jgi:hypothetical protein